MIYLKSTKYNVGAKMSLIKLNMETQMTWACDRYKSTKMPFYYRKNVM